MSGTVAFPYTGGRDAPVDGDGRPLAGPSGVLPVQGTFVAIGVSPLFIPISTRDFNISFWGTYTADFTIEKSYDYNPVTQMATTWITALSTSFLSWLPPTFSWNDAEYQIPYRICCTSYSSGTVNYRLSQ